MIGLIVAVGKNWEIGCENKLLFSLKKDMAFFKKTTEGGVVVMGKNTFNSLPFGALKNRKNIILSSNFEFEGQGDVAVVRDLAQLFDLIKDEHRQVYVIGGASVYRTLLPYCSYALITKVDAAADADTYFDDLDSHKDWELTTQSESEQDGEYNIRFCRYKNKNVKQFNR